MSYSSSSTSLDLAPVRAIQYARTLMPDDLRAVHFVLDEHHAEALTAAWLEYGMTQIELILSTVPTGASLARRSRPPPRPGRRPDRSRAAARAQYPGVWHRILHDQTADAIVRAVSDAACERHDRPFHSIRTGAEAGREAVRSIVTPRRRRRRAGRTRRPDRLRACARPQRGHLIANVQLRQPVCVEGRVETCGSDRSRGPRRSNACSRTLRACCRSCSGRAHPGHQGRTRMRDRDGRGSPRPARHPQPRLRPELRCLTTRGNPHGPMRSARSASRVDGAGRLSFASPNVPRSGSCSSPSARDLRKCVPSNARCRSRRGRAHVVGNDSVRGARGVAGRRTVTADFVENDGGIRRRSPAPAHRARRRVRRGGADRRASQAARTVERLRHDHTATASGAPSA